MHQIYFERAQIAEQLVPQPQQGVFSLCILEGPSSNLVLNLFLEQAAKAYLFYQRPLTALSFLSLFSVDSTSSAALRGRAIVSHSGTSRDNGTWKCSKDKGLSVCPHITEAKKVLPEDFEDLVDHMEEAETTVDVCSLCE